MSHNDLFVRNRRTNMELRIQRKFRIRLLLKINVGKNFFSLNLCLYWKDLNILRTKSRCMQIIESVRLKTVHVFHEIWKENSIKNNSK